MMTPGLVSITFRPLTPAQIVALVREAGGGGIEWGGDVHVPPGELARAREVRAMTEEAGVVVAAYGSYYRVGRSEADGLAFERVVETAVALGAPTIRVWAGTAGSAETGAAERARIGAELRRIAEVGAAAGVTVATEFHGGTLTDTNASARRLMEEGAHENLRSLWQPAVGASTEEALAGLDALTPWLANVHVFHWGAGGFQDRRPLAEGAERWRAFLTRAARAPRRAGAERFALLEFVAGDEPAAYVRDVATLRSWLTEL